MRANRKANAATSGSSTALVDMWSPPAVHSHPTSQGGRGPSFQVCAFVCVRVRVCVFVGGGGGGDRQMGMPEEGRGCMHELCVRIELLCVCSHAQ